MTQLSFLQNRYRTWQYPMPTPYPVLTAPSDFPNDYPWYGLGNIASDGSSSDNDERPTLMLALKCSVGLSEILHDAMTNIFSSKGLRKPPAMISSALGELNLRLNRWLAGLPEQLQWSQWTRKGKTLRRHVLELQ